MNTHTDPIAEVFDLRPSNEPLYSVQLVATYSPKQDFHLAYAVFNIASRLSFGTAQLMLNKQISQRTEYFGMVYPLNLSLSHRLAYIQYRIVPEGYTDPLMQEAIEPPSARSAHSAHNTQRAQHEEEQP